MPDTFTPDQFSQTQPIFTGRPMFQGAEAPATAAWVVEPRYPEGRRLCLIQRNDTRYWNNPNDEIETADWTIEELEAVAEGRNTLVGVTPLAAQALRLDFSCSFLLPPTQPADFDDFAQDSEARQEAIAGKAKLCRPASNGFLKIKALTQGLPANDPISPRSIRHSWLMAHFEVMDWAYWHGRRARKSLLPTEQLADQVCKLARKLSNLAAPYKPYSHNEASLADFCGDGERAALIRAADQSVRRRELKKLRARRAPVLRQLLAAIAAYQRARFSTCH